MMALIPVTGMYAAGAMDFFWVTIAGLAGGVVVIGLSVWLNK
jgi:hypothetical protein